MSIFDSVQKNKRMVQVLLILIALSFVLIGSERYLNFFGGEKNVVTFSNPMERFKKTEISRSELDESVQEEQNKLRGYLGSQYDEAFFNTPAFRREILQELVDRYLMVQETNDLNVMVSDRYIVQYIEKMPAFQENGRFSKEKLDSLLSQAGYTRAQLVNDVKRELFTRFVELVVRGSSIVSSRVATQLYDYLEQKRIVDAHLIKTATFLPKVSVTEEEIKKYYEAHLTQFETPEQIKVAYIALTPDDIEKQLTISDDEVNAYYQAKKSDYMIPEKRVARHILIKASDGNDDAAKKKIDELHAKLVKQPELFPELAKQYSEDAISPQQGGLLDPFAKEDLDPAFANALFSLRLQEISPVVKSQFGYHIIKLENIQPAKALELPEVIDSVRLAAMKDKLNQELSRQAEDFRDKIYQTDALEPAAKAFGLTVHTTDWISKDSTSENPWLANKTLRGQLFSSDVLKDKHNTDAVEVEPNIFVAARVIEYRPMTRDPLNKVSETIAARLKNQKAEALATQEGQKLIAALRKDPSYAVEWVQEGEISREVPKNLPESGMDAVMSADVSKVPAFTGALIGNGYAVYRIENVIYPKLLTPEENLQLKSLQEQLTIMISQDMLVAYRTALRAAADVNVNDTVLDKQN